MQKASMAFDGLGAGREAVAREEAGQQPVHGGLARVQGLAHRAVDDLHAGRLGGAGAERRQRLLGRQAQQPCGRDRGTDVSDGAGHVPADVVVPRAGGDRDAGLHLEAGDERLDGELAGDRDQLAPAAAIAGHSGALPWMVVRSGLKVSSKSSTCAAMPLASAA